MNKTILTHCSNEVHDRATITPLDELHHLVQLFN